MPTKAVEGGGWLLPRCCRSRERRSKEGACCHSGEGRSMLVQGRSSFDGRDCFGRWERSRRHGRSCTTGLPRGSQISAANALGAGCKQRPNTLQKEAGGCSRGKGRGGLKGGAGGSSKTPALFRGGCAMSLQPNGQRVESARAREVEVKAQRCARQSDTPPWCGFAGHGHENTDCADDEA